MWHSMRWASLPRHSKPVHRATLPFALGSLWLTGGEMSIPPSRPVTMPTPVAAPSRRFQRRGLRRAAGGAARCGSCAPAGSAAGSGSASAAGAEAGAAGELPFAGAAPATTRSAGSAAPASSVTGASSRPRSAAPPAVPSDGSAPVASGPRTSGCARSAISSMSSSRSGLTPTARANSCTACRGGSALPLR